MIRPSSRQQRSGLVACVLASFLALSTGVRSQERILELRFEDESELETFFAPEGTSAVDLCGEALPNGTLAIDNEELLLRNDDLLGIDLFSLDPDQVEDLFPDDTRDYKLRVRVQLDLVNQLLIYLRARVGVDRGNAQIDSLLERGYAFVVLPTGTLGDPRFSNGAVAIAEFGMCHTAIAHPEWPNAFDGFALAAPGFPVLPEDWYWLEVSAQGRDQGGPVLLSMSLWPEDDEPPAAPQLTVLDPNGLPHTPATLDPANNIEVLIGTSFDFGQQPGATARLDDLTIDTIGGCALKPVTVTRSLWEDTVVAEGRPSVLYEDGEAYTVTLTLTDRRPAGVCPAAGIVRILETAPVGWEIATPSHGGEVLGDNVARWEIDLAAGLPTLTYRVAALGGGRVSFAGELAEIDSGFQFVVEGASNAVGADAIAPISDFGSIQHWLTLGQFTRQVGGANPGEAEIRRDYLADGETNEREIQPRAGDQIIPDYNGDAASTGLAPNDLGRNPGDVPTWVEWIDFDDDDDRIDFESIYGAENDVMCHALTYLRVEEDITVNLGVSSDDSVQVLLDGVEIHINAAARGALNRGYQDTPLSHPGLGNILLEEGVHTLLVKVFEGGGEFNFRVGFVDEFGLEIPGGPEEIEISLEPGVVVPPAPRFVRADSNNSGSLEITDGILTLNFLFSGGAAPPCLDAADADDNGALQLSDPVLTFGFLFLGGAAPRPPGTSCGVDPTDDALTCERSTACAG